MPKITAEMQSECRRILESFDRPKVQTLVKKSKPVDMEKLIEGMKFLASRERRGPTLTLEISGSKARFMLINEEAADIVPITGRPHGNHVRQTRDSD